METLKGEVAFQAAGKDWKLLFDFNALCSIEQDLGIDASDLGGQISNVSVIRSVFRIGLEAHHAPLTDIEAGRLIHEIGVVKAGGLLEEAFKRAFPDAAKASTEGNAPTKGRGASRKR